MTELWTFLVETQNEEEGIHPSILRSEKERIKQERERHKFKFLLKLFYFYFYSIYWIILLFNLLKFEILFEHNKKIKDGGNQQI